MALQLHQSAYEYAQKLIRNRQYVLDQRGDWSDHRPARSAENRFIAEHGRAAFGKWHLGEDREQAEDSKRRYKFPYGDFQNVHHCAVLFAESRASQGKYTDIELAAARLHEMLDGLMAGKRSSERDYASSL
jgi:hypothetical protein